MMLDNLEENRNFYQSQADCQDELTIHDGNDKIPV